MKRNALLWGGHRLRWSGSGFFIGSQVDNDSAAGFIASEELKTVRGIRWVHVGGDSLQRCVLDVPDLLDQVEFHRERMVHEKEHLAALQGEPVKQVGSHSFLAGPIDPVVLSREKEGDLHETGWQWRRKPGYSLGIKVRERE
jgi:hypothetical protein